MWAPISSLRLGTTEATSAVWAALPLECPAAQSPARRHDIPMALSHRSLVAPGGRGLHNSARKADWPPKWPCLRPPTLRESSPALTFQWKPLSPRFSPDISRILTLHMHERRISQRNTDAANPTLRPRRPRRPRLPPRQVPQPWLQADGRTRTARLARRSRVSQFGVLAPPLVLLLFVPRLRLYLDSARPPSHLSSSTIPTYPGYVLA